MTSFCWPEVSAQLRRLLEGSTAYLEGKLKLRVNREKSGIVSLAFNWGNFKFLGFNMGKGRNG